jgi:catechol 2,3-dioxygenase-like lactoylglutathione lyase family enzyme
MRIRSIDHLVLVVKSLETTAEFYTRAFGMTVEEMRPGRWALKFGAQKLNLQQVGLSVDPMARRPTPGAADFCLLTDTPMEAVIKHLTDSGVQIADGPIRRTGATGPLMSVYVYDPDDNLVEISNQIPA